MGPTAQGKSPFNVKHVPKASSCERISFDTRILDPVQPPRLKISSYSNSLAPVGDPERSITGTILYYGISTTRDLERTVSSISACASAALSNSPSEKIRLRTEVFRYWENLAHSIIVDTAVEHADHQR
jgi:hypothetical protein